MAALEAEGELPVAVGVELDPQRGEIVDGGWSLVAEHAGGRQADSVSAGGDGVGKVSVRAVVAGQRGGQTALSPVARGLGQRGGGDERHAGAQPGRAERGVETGGASADDGYLGLNSGHLVGTVLADGRCPRAPRASVLAQARHRPAP